MTLLAMDRAHVLERIAPDLVRPLATVKRETIESALILCSGNRGEAAKRLKISRKALYESMRKWKDEL